MPGGFSNWSPYTEYVQRATDDSKNMKPGQFVNSRTVLLAAGPPFLDAVAQTAGAGGEAMNLFAFPIGLVQTWNLGQNQQVQQLFEVGSQRSYFMTGRSAGQIGLGRVFYHGPSLLRVLYAYYSDVLPPTAFGTLLGSGENSFLQGLINASMLPEHNVKVAPGHMNIFLNLASDLFTQPMGLMMYWTDSNEDPVASVYFEQCYVPQHTIGGDANGLIMQESCGIQYERMQPIETLAFSELMTQVTG